MQKSNLFLIDILIVSFLLSFFQCYGQCDGIQTFTLTPPPVNNTYSAGQVVTLCYTMENYVEVGANFIEGFDINLGTGWASVTPQTPPANCGGAVTNGQWIWMNSVTSTTSPVTTVGPGYFFDLNNDGNPGNDFGDYNGNNCEWTFCVQLTVASGCIPIPGNLLIQVTPGSDGVWGSWGSSSCDALYPNTVFNGTCGINFSATTSQIASTCGNSNGSATVTPSGGFPPFTYLWSPGGQTTQTATNLSPGLYSVTVNSSDSPTGQTVNQITQSVTVLNTPPLNLVIANQQNITCNSANNGIATITVTQGTAPYTYSWNTSSSISNTASDLIPGTNIFTVTDANFCTETIPVILTEPNPLAITFVSPDAMICSESTINLSAVGIGGSTPNAYTFTWTENGIPIGNGSTFNVDPINTGNVYCVTLSEQCGSPSPPEQCLTITFPTPIIPDVIVNDSKQCLPGDFLFSNTSINGSEIATMDYSFSNGFAYSTTNLNPLSAIFPYAGVYSVDLTVTSIYGCIYPSQIPNIIEVTPLPIAGFTISKNPATWFETTIQTNDVSFGNISSFVWSSVGASNITSNGNSAFISYPEGITGNYDIILLVTDSEGCIDSSILTMEIVPDIIFYTPNSFTPDDDEHNQSWIFYIEGIDFANFSLQIYNRWGEVIWETNDVVAQWDGCYNEIKVPAGSYPWKASFKAIDNDDKIQRTGLINVIR